MSKNKLNLLSIITIAKFSCAMEQVLLKMVAIVYILTILDNGCDRSSSMNL